MIKITKAIASNNTQYGKGYVISIKLDRTTKNWDASFISKVTISDINNHKIGKDDILFDVTKWKIKDFDYPKTLKPQRYETPFGLYVLGSDYGVNDKGEYDETKPGTIDIVVAEEYLLYSSPKGLKEVIAEADLNGEYIDCILNTTATEAIYDRQCVLRKFMQYIRNVDTCCDIPKDFINMFLLYEAFNVAIANCNYDLAEQYYNMMDCCNTHSINSTNTKSCGCHAK